jgi:1-acyl-sn-glycerol-3-phosphate acyltransferase
MLSKLWRIPATGFCFAVFGLGGVLIRLFGFPLLNLFVWKTAHRTKIARFIVHVFFQFFLGLMKFVRVLSYELHGVEKLQRKGLLVLANHPSLIDVVILISLIPQANCVVKSAVGKNPFMRGPVRAANYIINDEGVSMVDDCRASFAQDNTIVIFPEGTRTGQDGHIELKRGAANVAVRCRRPVTPVVITCVPATLQKKQPWYQVPPKKAHFTITVHDDIPVESFYDPSTSEPIAVRQLNSTLQSFFVQETRRAAV